MDNQNQPNPQTPQPQYQQNIIIVGKQKSVGVAFILAFFFGPLGLLYASVTGGIVMFFVGLVISIITLGFGIVFVWIGSIIWAVVAANNANSKAASGAGININVGTPPVQQIQPGQPAIQQQSIPETRPQPTVVQPPQPATEPPKVINEIPQKEIIYQPNPASLNSFSDWVTNNKKGLIFAFGGIVIILILVVAVKYVVSVDFSHKNHALAAAHSTKMADSAKTAANNLGGDTDAPTQFVPAYGSTNNAKSFPGVYPQASERLLSSNDLVNLDKNALKFMRNEIFARHGYIFKTALMKSYFMSQDWYRPLYNNVDNQLSSIEKANVELIKSYEK